MAISGMGLRALKKAETAMERKAKKAIGAALERHSSSWSIYEKPQHLRWKPGSKPEVLRFSAKVERHSEDYEFNENFLARGVVNLKTGFVKFFGKLMHGG